MLRVEDYHKVKSCEVECLALLTFPIRIKRVFGSRYV